MKQGFGKPANTTTSCIVKRILINIWCVYYSNVRYTVLLIVLVIAGACNYNALQPSPLFSPAIEANQQPTATPLRVQFVAATSTPIPTPASPSVLAEQKVAAGQAFEDGLPLAARVNNRPIFLSEYQRQLHQFEQTLRLQGVEINSKAGQAQLNQFQQQILESLLDQAIIEQYAEAAGITATPAEVEDKIKETVDQLPPSIRFEDWLHANRLTYEQFSNDLRSQLTAGQVFERVTQHVPLAADQVLVSYLVTQNRATAKEMISQLAQGASFETIAGADGAEVAATLRVWYVPGYKLLPQAVETGLKALQPGQAVGPIETAEGVYIIKLEDKAFNKPLTDQAIQTLKQQIFNRWLQQQRSTAVIEKFVAL